MALNHKDRRQANSHALIRMKEAPASVRGCKDRMDVQRRDSGQIHKVAVLRETDGDKRISVGLLALSVLQKMNERLTHNLSQVIGSPNQKNIRIRSPQHCSTNERSPP